MKLNKKDILAPKAKAKSGAARKRGAYHLLCAAACKNTFLKASGRILDANFEEKLKFPEMSYFVTFTVGT